MIIRLDLNPLPWTSGSAAAGRRHGKISASMYKDESLETYQQAVKGEIERMNLTDIPPEPWSLAFYFWRELEIGKAASTGRARRAHQVDATNMQKALEDALQGVLIGNDRDVRCAKSVIVDQGPNVPYGIVIVLNTYVPELDVPSAIWQKYEEWPASLREEDLNERPEIPKDVF